VQPAATTYAARPDLVERLEELSDPWPEFIHHANCNRLWHVMRERHPQFQLILYDEENDRPLGRGQTMPVRWDGTVDGLPGGVDDAVEHGAALADGQANTLCAIVAVLDRSVQGQGLSGLVIDAMRAAAAAGGLDCLIAPVRPTLKDRYPLTPIESYARWLRDDGSAFDPWIRVHERLGGRILGIADCSMTVEGGVAEWESWTGMAFPESGAYVLPQALVPIEIDRASGRGRYVEPNVWMRHSPRGA
jgi:GNAT superfamily N-acetyltransferase